MTEKKLKSLISLVEKINKKAEKSKKSSTKDTSSKFNNLTVYKYSEYKKEGGKLSKPTFLKYRAMQILDNEKEKTKILAQITDIYNAGYQVKNTSIDIHKGLTGLIIKNKTQLLGSFDYKETHVRIEAEGNKTYLCIYDYNIDNWETQFEKIIQLGKSNGFSGYVSWEEYQEKNKKQKKPQNLIKTKEEFDQYIIECIKSKGLTKFSYIELKPYKEPLKIELSSHQ